MRKLSVAKFGGSLLNYEGEKIPAILDCIRCLKDNADLGPLIVFSAPNGFTDELIRIGESCTQHNPLSVNSIFNTYQRLAETYVTGKYLKQAIREMEKYHMQVNAAATLINKRFGGTIKAKFLTNGGELPTSILMEYILKSNGLDCCHISKEKWPLVTDDNFENATPIYELSKNKINYLLDSLEAGKIVVHAGFLGITSDGLETMLGRGGSDLTAVFLSCLLKEKYDVETFLFKDTPVQSADPNLVNDQKTEHLASMTYNEAHKASMMGMKIVQGDAISVAKQFNQPIQVALIEKPGMYTMIEAESDVDQTVKCVTGKIGCAILTIHDQKSRSLEDSLRIWENRNDFLELGTEILETGEKIRDFLFLDSDFLRKNEERLKGFDENLKMEYDVGVVTIIGDRMKYSSGVASIAIGAIPGINIKRGVFAPHTSQIILVVDESKVGATVSAIHAKRPEMNKLH